MNRFVETAPELPPNVGDLLGRLGDVPPERVRLAPPPGHATAADLAELQARGDRLCELIDGVLVEKTVGWFESRLAALLIHYLSQHILPRRMGVLLPPDAALRIAPPNVHLPDVSFFSWERWPSPDVRTELIPTAVPDLAVEVLSPSNRPGEMQNKLSAYFSAGVRVVWFIDPATRSARVFVGPENFREIGPDGELDGGDVLPGFRLKLGEWFREAESSA